MALSLTKLPTRTVEKIWGMDQLPPPFIAPEGEVIGEIWFEPPAEFPQILVKYIFASQNLSIQTHPSDKQAQAAGLGLSGKEECWLVLDAKPSAQLAIGFKEEISPSDVRSAIGGGSLEDLLMWHEVVPGDFFYIPANTVHAIGAGVSLVEVQQNSDVTYRLYDYGRPRELHLDEGLAVANLGPYPNNLQRTVRPNEHTKLVSGPFFSLFHAVGIWTPETTAETRCLIVPLTTPCSIVGQSIKPGECAIAKGSDFEVESDSSFLVIL